MIWDGMETIYQDKILELAKIARTSTKLPDCDLTATKNNPLCGDRVTVSVSLDGEFISAINVKVKGCALCEAGAGLLQKIAPGATRDALQGYAICLANWLKDPVDDIPPIPPAGSELLAPIRHIKNRHKCILLAFDAISDLKCT